MTDEELIALGCYCEGLLQDDQFNVLVSQFERSTLANILNTRPDDKAHREQVYFTYNGLREFLGLAKQLVEEKDKLLAKSEETDQDE